MTILSLPSLVKSGNPPQTATFKDQFPGTTFYSKWSIRDNLKKKKKKERFLNITNRVELVQWTNYKSNSVINKWRNKEKRG